MNGRVYLDASAAVKLAVDEVETQALVRYLGEQETRVSSRVLIVEVMRAVRRRSPGALGKSQAVMDLFQIIELDKRIALRAGELEPMGLRSLDAVHLASALSLGVELDAFVTYDARQADAARAAGLEVVTPQ